jgi:hypothetical protein
VQRDIKKLTVIAIEKLIVPWGGKNLPISILYVEFTPVFIFFITGLPKNCEPFLQSNGLATVQSMVVN